MRTKRNIHWAVILAAESAILFMIAAAAALTEWLPLVVSNICLWCGYPLASAVAAYFATRRGLNNYAAWIPGPVMYPAGYFVVWGYLTSAGPLFISALLAIIGAAAGEVKNQFERGRK